MTLRRLILLMLFAAVSPGLLMIFLFGCSWLVGGCSSQKPAPQSPPNPKQVIHRVENTNAPPPVPKPSAAPRQLVSLCTNIAFTNPVDGMTYRWQWNDVVIDTVACSNIFVCARTNQPSSCRVATVKAGLPSAWSRPALRVFETQWAVGSNRVIFPTTGISGMLTATNTGKSITVLGRRESGSWFVVTNFSTTATNQPRIDFSARWTWTS